MKKLICAMLFSFVLLVSTATSQAYYEMSEFGDGMGYYDDTVEVQENVDYKKFYFSVEEKYEWENTEFDFIWDMDCYNGDKIAYRYKHSDGKWGDWHWTSVWDDTFQTRVFKMVWADVKGYSFT